MATRDRRRIQGRVRYAPIHAIGRRNAEFHLAPQVAVKFRGLPPSRIDAATEAALSSFVASHEQAGGAFDDPHLAFAFCYLASHFGLDLISEECVDEVMGFLEENSARLAEMAGRAGLAPNRSTSDIGAQLRRWWHSSNGG